MFARSVVISYRRRDPPLTKKNCWKVRDQQPRPNALLTSGQFLHLHIFRNCRYSSGVAGHEWRRRAGELKSIMTIAAPEARRRAVTREERKVIIASSAGTVFEWYDFYLYGALASIIGAQFFAAYSDTQQNIFALLTFAAGFLVRPLVPSSSAASATSSAASARSS